MFRFPSGWFKHLPQIDRAAEALRSNLAEEQIQERGWNQFRSRFFDLTMKARELKLFINDGFGWVCKKCSDEADNETSNRDRSKSRLLFEGEAESRSPRLSIIAIAKWTDREKTILYCPICEKEEKVPE